MAWRSDLNTLLAGGPLDAARNVRAVLNAKWRLRAATELGPKVRLAGKPFVTNEGTLRIADRARLVSTVVPLELAVGRGAELSIGAQTFINYGTSIGAQERIVIGARCSIGTYVIIMDNDFHRIEPERRDEKPPSAPIVLEDNVWLGARVTVLRGVTIGAGSAVGAGSVVTKDIPPRSVAIGSPARVVRQL